MPKSYTWLSMYIHSSQISDKKKYTHKRLDGEDEYLWGAGHYALPYKNWLHLPVQTEISYATTDL